MLLLVRVADCEYLKPQFAVDKLKEKLERIGLTVADVAIRRRQR